MLKQIRTLSDLAINGQSPLFREPVHIGRPNIGNKQAFDRLVGDMFDRAWLSNDGPLVRRLEAELARYLNVEHCIAMCNGTIALEIAIRALELRGEVIVPSYTFVATAHALQWQEITPIFADVDPNTHNLDPAAVLRMITPKTTGVLGVHLWGRPAPIGELTQIAKEHKLRLLFDASHAFGCTHNGRPIGSFGECEVFSFHATKLFNTFEGGAVATRSDELAAKIRLMRNFGFAGYDNVIYPGTNGKMQEISAAMGIANLGSIQSFIRRNTDNYTAYVKAFERISSVKLIDYDFTERNNFQYIVLELLPGYGTPRDEVVRILHAENVLARKYFWPGCHRMEPYRSCYPHARLMLPHTEQIAARVVVLPTGQSVDADSIGAIANIIELLGEAH